MSFMGEIKLYVMSDHFYEWANSAKGLLSFQAG